MNPVSGFGVGGLSGGTGRVSMLSAEEQGPTYEGGNPSSLSTCLSRATGVRPQTIRTAVDVNSAVEIAVAGS